jgi:hypothetical protein
MSPRKVIEGIASHVTREDGGQAVIVELDTAEDEMHVPEGEGMFVRLQSWSERKRHAEIEQFIGKRVRVTVELIE